MTEQELKDRLKQFALRVIRLCDSLPSRRSAGVIAGQLLRSGTSPGANYRSACRARSLADFVAKLAIAEEEMDESTYWLELIMDSGMKPRKLVGDLHRESEECTKILTASRITAKSNGEAARVELIKNRKSKMENRKSG